MNSNEKISAEALARYLTQPQKNYDIEDDGSLSVTEEWNLSCVIDAKLQDICMPLTWGTFHEQGRDKFFALADDVPLEQATKIAGDFNAMNQRLIAAKISGDIPTKAEVVKAYGDFFLLLQPTTDAAVQLRELIERAFAALELGEMPPLPSQDIEGTPIDPARLEHYAKDLHINCNKRTDGSVFANKDHPSVYLSIIMHGSGTNMIPFMWGDEYFTNYVQQIPVTAGTTAQSAQYLALKFSAMERSLTHAFVDKTPCPSAEAVQRTFSRVHNMLQPTTDANIYMRTMIERALDTLGIDDSLLDSRSAVQFAEIERRLAKQSSTARDTL